MTGSPDIVCLGIYSNCREASFLLGQCADAQETYFSTWIISHKETRITDSQTIWDVFNESDPHIQLQNYANNSPQGNSIEENTVAAPLSHHGSKPNWAPTGFKNYFLTASVWLWGKQTWTQLFFKKSYVVQPQVYIPKRRKGYCMPHWLCHSLNLVSLQLFITELKTIAWALLEKSEAQTW